MKRGCGGMKRRAKVLAIAVCWESEGLMCGKLGLGSFFYEFHQTHNTLYPQLTNALATFLWPALPLHHAAQSLIVGISQQSLERVHP